MDDKLNWFKKYSRRMGGFMTAERCAVLLLFIGILVRLKYYLENCSLCPDESYVAMEIVHRSLKEIFHYVRIIPSHPNHPIFFVLAVKSAVFLSGNCEYVLRFVPVVSGVVSVILFYRLLKKVLPSVFRLLALALFIFCDQLIYFSSELKPYATDVLVAVCLYLFFERSHKKKFGLWLAAQWGLAGAAAMWLSSSSIFILGGIGTVWLLSFMRRRQWKNLGLLGITFIFWLESFTPLYYLAFRPMTTNETLIGMWENYSPFMPHPLGSYENILWFKSIFLQMFNNPMGLPLVYFAAAVFWAGCFSLYRTDRKRFSAFMVPILLTLAAAMLKKYPFYGRMLLFLTPGLFIFMAAGVAWLAQTTKAGAKWIVVLAAGLLLYYPIYQTGYFLAHARCSDYGREAMGYLEDNYRPGGLMYVSGDSAFTFAYYASQTKFIEALPVSFLIHGDNQKLKGVKWGRFPHHLCRDKSKPQLQFCYQFYCFDESGHFRTILLHDDISQIHKIFHGAGDDFIDHQDAWVYIAYSQPEAKKIILDYFDTHAIRVKQFEIETTGLYLFSFNE